MLGRFCWCTSVWQLDRQILVVAVRSLDVVVFALAFVLVSKDVVCVVELIVVELVPVVPFCI